MKITFFGPATVHLANWLGEFYRAGIEVSLITLHRESSFQAPCPVTDLSSIGSGLRLFRVLPALQRALERDSSDLLVAYYASSYGFLARVSGFKPYVVATAGSDINHALRSRPYLFPFVSCALFGAAKVLCWSESMKDVLLRYGLPAGRIFVQARGIPLERFDAASGRNGVSTLTCIRRFTPIFHHDCLIEACSRLAQESVPFRLLLGGDGPLRASIENLVVRKGLADNVRFLGPLPYAGVADVLKQSDVYVSLSESDGASASLFEAMAAGCVPVVSDIPANRLWIRNGHNGRLVAFDRPCEVARTLREVLEDPRGCREFGLRNRARAEQEFSLRKNTARFIQLFDQVVQEIPKCP